MYRRDRSRPGPGWFPGGPAGLVRRLAFWLAIVLPAAYGPLFVTGLDDRTGAVLAGLACLNLLCLVVGHDYSP